MLPYNRKIWSLDLERLGTYWLYKLPDVSFKETLHSCLERLAHGALPAHGTFLYPKEHGYGEVWKRMGEALGDRLVTGTPVTGIDLDARLVNGYFHGEHLVTTIPWTLWPSFCDIPAEIRIPLSRLVHASIDVDYCADTPDTDAHWLYEPDQERSYHRILCRSNFFRESRGYWTETNAARAGAPKGWRHRNEFAYPLNTIDKPAAIAAVMAWGETRGIHSLGRWGTWEHMNSDMAVLSGINTAEAVLKRESKP